MIQNLTELYHLEHLGGLETETIQMPPKLYIWSIWAAFGPQLTKILPKLVMWSVWVALSPK